MARGSWLSRAAAFLGVGDQGVGDRAAEPGQGDAAEPGEKAGAGRRSPNDSEPRPARLVLDTNVFVAAAYKPESSSRRLLEAVASGRAVLLVSVPVFGEYRKVLPKAIRAAGAEDQVRDWIARGEPVPVGRAGRVVPDDPSDDKFVALARAGSADAIVSSDGHLLDLAGRIDVPVLRPGEAVRLVERV